MTDKVKKQLIFNLPYLIFVYLFNKLYQGVRLAPGADASEKLLHIGQGFSAAFASAAPSFHPTDLLIGLAAAVIIRLVVYSKQKNAKKYRKGMEYGTARWGTAADIKPFIDPVFDNNVLLTATERLMMSNRPKDPKNARNKNILVIGGSGSGKTRFFCKPNIMQLHSCPVPSSGGCGIDCKRVKIRGYAISPLFTRAHLYTVAGAVRPAGSVAYFVRDGKLRSPNPLCALRSQTPALRLSGSTEPVIPSLKGGVPHRFLSYPRQYHQAQRRPFCRCRSCLPQRNQADK